MKWLSTFLILLSITSCGKKGDGPSPIGDTPLHPAPAISVTPPENSSPADLALEEEVNQEESKERLPDLEERGLRIEPPVVICFNNEVLNFEKLLELQQILALIHKDEFELSYSKKFMIRLLEMAITSLEQSDPNSRFCPKIYLAINQEFNL